MNQGKICISLCAKTADDLIRQIELAEKLADVVELRFDCLHDGEIERAIEILPDSKKQFLVTYRPADQGGRQELTLAKRLKFWENTLSRLKPGYMIDIELDPKLLFAISPERATRIVSYHDFNRGRDWETLLNVTGDNIKIAVGTNDIADTISVWKYFQKTRPEKNVIPIAMGEAGKWTRILGLAHGAFMTYASLESGGETAPGQISADDLIDLYRVKELDKATGVYGIIGGNTSYSVSPYMHNSAFKAAKMNSVFVPLQVADLDAFMQRMVKPATREIELNFKGFSVTNPHKQAIINHLDVVDETAEKIGAVNTIKIEGEKFYGYNTDATGFIAPLKKSFGDLAGVKAAVAGAGGAARACVYSLLQEKAEVTLLARHPRKAEALAQEFEIDVLQLANDHRPLATFDIIINATPLGTRGEYENETVAIAEQLKDAKLVYDLVYNPAETRLLREAKLAGVPAIGGIEMLIGQGVKQFEIWTGADAPINEMRSAVRKRLDLLTYDGLSSPSSLEKK